MFLIGTMSRLGGYELNYSARGNVRFWPVSASVQECCFDPKRLYRFPESGRSFGREVS